MATNTGWIDYNEGAAPATPAASKVRLYAKSDGLLYSKDDAGTETLVSGGAGGGAVATDAIWDAAGDLAVGTGANTAAKLTKGADGGVLAMGNGAVIWNAGTSFPASKATGDRYFRTDLGIEAYWDGTRWLSTQIERCSFMGGVIVDTGFNGAAINAGRQAVPWKGTYGLYILQMDCYIIVQTTTNSSNKWTIKFNWADATDSDTQLGSTQDTGSDTADRNTYHSTVVNAVLSTNAVQLKFRLDKSGSPGACTGAAASFSYRLVLT